MIQGRRLESRALVFGLALVIAGSVTSVRAQDGFRIETDIFLEGKAEPLTQTLTLFQDGIAYDIPRQDGQDITMVDPSYDRIIRFSEATSLQTTVKISELKKLMESAKKQAENTGLAVFLQGAQKVEASDERVVVGDEQLRYEASLQRPPKPENASIYAKTYREFADAVKLLNSFGGMDPPFARLSLNAAVHEQDAIPEEIRVHMQRGKDETIYVCRLHTTWMLSKTDRKRIADIQKMLVNYQDVGPSEYEKRNRENRVASKPK